MQVFSGHTNRVNDVAFSLDGRRLASCSTDGTVRVWDCLTGEGEVIHRVAPNSLDELGGVAFAAGSGLVVRSRWRGLQVWGTDTRACAATLVSAAHTVHAVAVHPTGRMVAVVDPTTYDACFVRVWSAHNWTEIDRHQLPTANQRGCTFRGLAFDPTGTRLATSSGVIVARSGAVLSEVGFAGDRLLWSPDGALVAGTPNGAKVLVVYDAGTGNVVRAVRLGGKEVQDFAFSADGRQLVVVSNEETVRSWDTRTWDEAPALVWGIGKLKCLAFSPDGTRAACGGHRGAIVVWDVS